MDLYLGYLQGLNTGKKTLPPIAERAIERLLVSRFMLNDSSNDVILVNMIKDLLSLGLVGEAYQAYNLLNNDFKSNLASVFASILNLNSSNKLDLTIEIITKCNVKCPLCFHGNGRYYDKPYKVMSLDNFKIIWDKVKDYTKQAILVGIGESFLHPNFYDIVEYIGNVPIHLDTNGNIKADYHRLFNSSLSTLIFSIDGTEQSNYEKYRVGGNFNLAIENVKKAVEAKKSIGHGPIIIFKYIIFKHNEMYLDQAREMALGLGVDRFQVNECNLSPQSSPDTVKKFIPCGSNATSRIRYIDYENNLVIPTEFFDSQYCTTPLNKPYIQVDGVVQPCCAAYKPGFFKKCVSDKDVEDKNTWDQRFNLLEKSLEEIWQDPWMNDFRVGALSNRHQMDSCRYCLMPTNSVNHIFTHSILESKHIYSHSSNILDIKKFMIDIDDIKYLINENLDNEIKYYVSSNSLTGDAKDFLNNSKYLYSN